MITLLDSVSFKGSLLEASATIVFQPLMKSTSREAHPQLILVAEKQAKREEKYFPIKNHQYILLNH